MHTDQFEDDVLEFGDSPFDGDATTEGWDLVDDMALIDDVVSNDDAAVDADEPVAPTAEQIQQLLSNFEQNEDEPTALASGDGSVTDSNQPAPVASAAKPPVAGTSSDQSTTIDSLDDELREAFLDDAQGCIAAMEQALLQLEAAPNDTEALNQICRQLHTLKGASASVGLCPLADQLHELEDTLTDDQKAGRAPQIGELLASVDSVRSQILGTNTAGNGDTSADQSAEAACTLSTFDDAADDDESVRVKSSQLNRLMDMLAQLVMLRNRRGNELAELQEVYHELIGSVAKMRMISSETDANTAECSSLQLSEVANDVLEVAQQVRECSLPISEGNNAVSQFIREFREELVELRRTPIGGLFRRLQRVVRDAAAAEGKEVRLELIGTDAGIERALQQRLYEPLLHIVRNSVCHGIESPGDRQQAGKQCCGTISLQATSGPDLFVIEIRDDGRGLDYPAIRRRAIESGLLTSDQNPSQDELAQLIFHPGFSTRQTADQIAGRGVGMDVVATTLQRMRGWLEVESHMNQGTRIRLSFPLPSVIQHAMVFRAANQLFAIPMQSIQATGQTDTIGSTINLSELLGAGASQATPTQKIAINGAAQGTDSNQLATLLVDEIVGPEELVVRPLPQLLRRHPFCGGATLSGMGSTVLFLDAQRLIAAQSTNSGDRIPAPAAKPEPTRRNLRVLVADDSISARKRVVRSLRRYGVQIVEASDGKQALELLKRNSFAAVFSDMEMPNVSGMELLADVNNKADIDSPPVVIISSRNEAEFTDRAAELGANNYLIKPLTDEALDQAIIGIPSLRNLKPIDTPVA